MNHMKDFLDVLNVRCVQILRSWALLFNFSGSHPNQLVGWFGRMVAKYRSIHITWESWLRRNVKEQDLCYFPTTKLRFLILSKPWTWYDPATMNVLTCQHTYILFYQSAILTHLCDFPSSLKKISIFCHFEAQNCGRLLKHSSTSVRNSSSLYEIYTIPALTHSHTMVLFSFYQNQISKKFAQINFYRKIT